MEDSGDLGAGLLGGLEAGAGQTGQGARTPYTPQSEVPFFYSLIGSTSTVLEVQGEVVFPHSAEKCFNLLKDYRLFLVDHLKPNQENSKIPNFTADPQWIQEGQEGYGSVGSLVQYAFDIDGIVYWMVDEVTTLKSDKLDNNNQPIYQFAMKTRWDLSNPKMVMKGHGTRMTFTTFQNDPNKCHLTWVRHYLKPIALGCVSLAERFHVQFTGYMRRDIISLKQTYNNMYYARLPRKSQKVLIVGAGPSGLHMAHLLANRGIATDDITILEQTDRYGGKTLSIKEKALNQIHQAQYTPLPPTGVTACRQSTDMCLSTSSAIACSFCQPVTVCCSMPGTVDLSEEEVKENNRNKIPNALSYRPSWEAYFDGGDPVWHELGTCYLSPGYYAIRTLMSELQAMTIKRRNKAIASGNPAEQAKWTAIANIDVTKEVGPDTYSIETPSKINTDLDGWVFSTGKENTILDNIFLCCQTQAVNVSLLAAKAKYCTLHKKYMGSFYYTLPPRPLDEVYENINMSFGQFLSSNGLDSLTPLFTYALTAQGYGIISDTPAFCAMQWLTPDLLDGYFEWYEFFNLYKDANGIVVKPVPEHLKRFDNPRKGMLVNGWISIWDRIVDLHDLGRPNEEQKSIRYNVSQLEIRRTDEESGAIHASYSRHLPDGSFENFEELYDYLIVAAPLSDAAKDPTQKTLNIDLTEEESKVLLHPSIVAGQFSTTLFNAEPDPSFKDHVRIFIDKLLGPEAGDGSVFATRDSYKAIQPRLSTENGHLFDPARYAPREQMCYQYISPGRNFELEKTKEQFLDFYIKSFRQRDYIRNLPEKERNARIERDIIITHKLWTYYTHYEGEGLKNGLPWDILEFQGKKHTLFVHGSTNFESVLDIVNYNHMLLDGLTGVLDELERPKNDTRPDEWQRPQNYLFYQVLKWINRFLNFFFIIGWTIIYVITYPIAELWYLRFYRYGLQKSFQTPDLGSPWSYNMEKFINVSPSSRGYIDTRKGLNPGPVDPDAEGYDPFFYDAQHPPGDTIFKILMQKKSGFLARYPGVPDYKTIKSSFEWSLHDLRLGVRHWLRTFDDTFQPILSTFAGVFLEWVAYYTPNMYGFWFSWVMASQFRLLIGYSYRFEDEKGGGLYIPECKMLKQAVKSHGPEAGQRICQTVCKVFTEEVLLKKNIQATFHPNYDTGSGCSCIVRTVPPKTAAFPSHNLFQFRTEAEEKAFERIDLTW